MSHIVGTILDTTLGHGMYNMTLGAIPEVSTALGGLGTNLGLMASNVGSLVSSLLSVGGSVATLSAAAFTNPYILGAGAVVVAGTAGLVNSSKIQTVFRRSSTFKHTVDVTKQASEGKIPRAYGRDKLVDRLVGTLENPGFAILLGDSGAGKSAIAAELAHKIVRGEIPSLTGARLLRLNLKSMEQNLGLMGMLGDFWNGGFEKYVRKLLEDLDKAHGKGQQYILFVDEIQDLLNRNPALFDSFKEELGNGTLKIIGATTDKGIIQTLRGRDGTGAGMERRIEVINVLPMTEKAAIEVLKHLAVELQSKYQPLGCTFKFSDDFYEAAVALSKESAKSTLPNCATTFVMRMCTHYFNKKKGDTVTLGARDVINFTAYIRNQSRDTVAQKLKEYKAHHLEPDTFPEQFLPQVNPADHPLPFLTQTGQRLQGFFAASPDQPWMVLNGESTELALDVASTFQDQLVYRCDVMKLARMANTEDGKQYLAETLEGIFRGGVGRPVLVLENFNPEWCSSLSSAPASIDVPDVVRELGNTSVGRFVRTTATRMGVDPSEIAAMANSTPSAPKATTPEVIRRLLTFIQQEKVCTVMVNSKAEAAQMPFPGWSSQKLASPTLDETVSWLKARYQQAGGTGDGAWISTRVVFALHHLRSPSVLDFADKIVTTKAKNPAQNVQDNIKHALPYLSDDVIAAALIRADRENNTPVCAPLPLKVSVGCPEALKLKLRSLIGAPEDKAVLWVAENSRVRRAHIMDQIATELTDKKCVYFNYALIREMPSALKTLVLAKIRSEFDPASVLVIEEEALRDPEVAQLLREKPCRVVGLKLKQKERSATSSQESVLGGLVQQARSLFETIVEEIPSAERIFSKEFEYNPNGLTSIELKQLLGRSLQGVSHEETLKSLYLLLAQKPDASLDDVVRQMEADLALYSGKSVAQMCDQFHTVYGKPLNMSLSGIKYEADHTLTSKSYRFFRGSAAVLSTGATVLSYPLRKTFGLLGILVFGVGGFVVSKTATWLRQRFIGI